MSSLPSVFVDESIKNIFALFIDNGNTFSSYLGLEAIATAPVFSTKGTIRVPKTALLAQRNTVYVYVQTDPEHFRKQAVQAGK